MTEPPAAVPRQSAIRAVIVDDHTLMRDGIKELLSTVDDFEVVGEGSDGDQAVALAARLRPDVLLLDVEMKGPGPRATVRQIRQASPRTQIVVLTMHEESELVHDLLEQGAVAYLAKSISRDGLVAALRSVCRSPSTVLLQVTREALEGLERGKAPDNPLSTREMQILRLAAQAMSNAQIARQLFIAEGTVKRHLTNIYTKLGAVSRVDAIRKATAARLIDAEHDS